MQEHPDIEGSDETRPPADTDYTYDLAHESRASASGTADQAPGEEERPAVYVATETNDHEGDYSYDLAHDIPAQ